VVLTLQKLCPGLGRAKSSRESGENNRERRVKRYDKGAQNSNGSAHKGVRVCSDEREWRIEWRGGDV
jgi:hypothetical protein